MPRWTYHIENDSPILSVPEFVMFGSDEIRRAMPLFEHEHPGCYEFVLIERGQASWAIGDAIYETQAGDLFYSRPGEKHRGGFNVIEPCKFWWVIITAPQHEGWLRLPSEECRLIEQSLAQLPRVIPIGLHPVDSFKKLQHALTEASLLRSTKVRHALTDLLLMITQPVTGSRSVADDLLLQFDRIIARLGHEPEWRPSVDELAASAGVSASHFYRTFQEYTGEPPMTFIERQRVKMACRQLTETKDSITEISHRLGYQSSQHFATVFKRFVGVTPTGWRKSGVLSSKPFPNTDNI
ncbi:helix-turn-helix domain-containing protein [Paenibacillus guangzhouensis]|uniref:helix-turn-helix domain-containing protein n=1 Tax=Paenibacillus guangzhouensis TaxID=1473112 RepID=UPI0012669D53|nr:AraC family transcriptional regulator [Paenibacillus guangzhouensis]